MSDQKPCGCSSANGRILRNPAICQKHPACPNAPKPAEPKGGACGCGHPLSEHEPRFEGCDYCDCTINAKGSEPIDFEAAKRFAVFMHDAPAPTNPDEREIARAYLALAAKLKERDEEITQLLEACGDMELKRAIRARRKEAKR